MEMTMSRSGNLRVSAAVGSLAGAAAGYVAAKAAGSQTTYTVAPTAYVAPAIPRARYPLSLRPVTYTPTSYYPSAGYYSPAYQYPNMAYYNSAYSSPILYQQPGYYYAQPIYARPNPLVSGVAALASGIGRLMNRPSYPQYNSALPVNQPLMQQPLARTQPAICKTRNASAAPMSTTPDFLKPEWDSQCGRMNVQTASFGRSNYSMSNPIASGVGNVAGGLGRGIGSIFGGIAGGIASFFRGIGDGFSNSFAAATTRQPTYQYAMQPQPMMVAANENRVVCYRVPAQNIAAQVAAAPPVNCA